MEFFVSSLSLSPHHLPSSVSQAGWASFSRTPYGWLTELSVSCVRVCSCSSAAFSATSPLVTGGFKKKTKNNFQPSVGAEDWKSGGEMGEGVNGRVSCWRGRAVQAWDLPIWSFYLHNNISVNHFLWFIFTTGVQTPLYTVFFLLPLILSPLMTDQLTEFQHFAK